MSLAGHCVVISEGWRGTGAAIAQAGVRLVSVDAGLGGPEGVAGRCRKAGGTATTYSVDWTDAAVVSMFAEEIVAVDTSLPTREVDHLLRLRIERIDPAWAWSGSLLPPCM